MKLTDRRLYQAATIQDFFFRLHFREEDALRRIATREIDQLITTAFEAPGTEQIWGIDISDWDGNVDLRVTRNSGASFAIIKAMDGTIPSKYWRANHQRAVHRTVVSRWQSYTEPTLSAP